MENYYFVLNDGIILGMSEDFPIALKMWHEGAKCLKTGNLELRRFQFNDRGYSVDIELIREVKFYSE